MGKARVDLAEEWRWERTAAGIYFRYPAPVGANGFIPCGFVRKNDSAADFAGWHGIFLRIGRGGQGNAGNAGAAEAVNSTGEAKNTKSAKAAEEAAGGRQPKGRQSVETVTVKVTVFFAEEAELTTKVSVPLRNGEADLEIPFSRFPLERAKENRWEFVTAVAVECVKESGEAVADMEVAECSVRRRPGIYLEMPVKGKSGVPGEKLTYRGTVYNCTGEPLMIDAGQSFEGWESLMAEIRLGESADECTEAGMEESTQKCIKESGKAGAKKCAEECGEAAAGKGKKSGALELAPGESIPLTVSVTVHDYMVPGGHENTCIRVWGQGSSISCQDSAELKTLRHIQHPYLYHNLAQWKQSWENIRSYGPYREDFEEYRRTADAWRVTDTREGRPFCYETAVESGVMSAAYLYALTGEQGYAEKLADFFRRFSDPVKGYPARKRGCSQSYVQEGHFFKHLAVAYDIVCDSGLLTGEDKAAVERCFRLYMEMLDMHVRDGRISNWLLSELQGAAFCALAIQDMDRALRFVFGSGGIIEQFRHGIFNDGWWHECSVGYNTWVSSIMLHTARALLPFGYNLIHTRFQAPLNREVSSVYRGESQNVKSGMYNLKWGGNRKPYVCIQDMFDATLPFLDDRGVLFGIADSDEKRLSGAHFGSTYDLAYYYYRKSEYLRIIGQNKADCIFGDPRVHKSAVAAIKGHICDKAGGLRETEDCDRADVSVEGDICPGGVSPEEAYLGNAYADNIGLALLRSRKPGRRQRDQIQAVLRYGSHGGAHGHFDITDLLSIMRYGRSFFNPENCWWGYAHFMYKFYVQCSLTKNMVTVDEKMQIPADSRRILWHSGRKLQAAGIEVRTRWSYPPYGGMVYYQDGQEPTKEALEKRCKMNGCYLPIVRGADSPVYGEMSGFTEPILQRRVMAVTDDYIVLFDYARGEEEHCYDSLMQIKGFLGIEGEGVSRTGHTEQMNPNPVSDAQFITDCDWYRVKGESVAHFCTVFTEEHAGERLVCDRSNYNEPGTLNMDVHTAWPRKTEQMTGRVAVYEGWAADGNGYTIPLSYRVDLDGEAASSGEFDGWILGRGEVSVDVTGVAEAKMSLRQGCRYNEIGEPVRTPQGVFWGEICLELADGRLLNLGQCLKEETARMKSTEEKSGAPENIGGDNSRETAGIRDRIRTENLDMSCGIGRDYKGGRVTIVGTEYPYSLGASPADHGSESRIILNLEGLSAVKLTACVGVDAFPGDEWQKRKTYAVRTRGRSARFVTVIEPYEAESVIESVSAGDPDRVQVELKDGRVQEIWLRGMEEEKAKPEIDFREEKENHK